jgi:hypothetical protein
MIGSSLPLCYPQIGASELLYLCALCSIWLLTKHIRPLHERQGRDGGSRRVFRRFSWHEAGSVKAASSRPTHQRVTHTVGQVVYSTFGFSFRIYICLHALGLASDSDLFGLAGRFVRVRAFALPFYE